MIDTMSYPATKLAYPAITVCKEDRYDVGEYIRAVFDNFQYAIGDEYGGKVEGKESIRAEYDALADGGEFDYDSGKPKRDECVSSLIGFCFKFCFIFN